MWLLIGRTLLNSADRLIDLQGYHQDPNARDFWHHRKIDQIDVEGIETHVQLVRDRWLWCEYR